ncbi:hypothetical protein ACN469_12925 [Corallococcus terminator]
MALFVMACGNMEEVPGSAIESEPLGEQVSELRSCSSSLDCRATCGCNPSGFCEAGFSPPPPAGFCDVAPVRACGTGADCTTGCSCSSNVCLAIGGFSPPPNCLLAPPDSYESDNSHTTASSYLGYPQLGHTFHRAGDVDWVLGATNINQLMTVEAYNVRNGASLRLDVYAYDHATRTLGALLTSVSTRVCSDFTPACLMYRTAVNVTPGVYAVKVTDTRNVPTGSDWRPTAGYDLKMY